MIDAWLETLSVILQENLWFAPFLAFLAGVLTAFTPCSLSSVPLVIGYVGGAGANEPKRAFQLSVIFAGGMALTFTSLGVIAALAGNLMGTASPFWYILLGVLMVLMALQIFGIYNFIPSTFLIAKSTKRGRFGAFAAGVLGGLFSSPCATPVLIVLLAFVAKEGAVGKGLLLLFLYAIGHSTLVILAGTSVAFARKITSGTKYGLLSKLLNILLGSAILLLGLYMFYLGF